MKCFLGEFVYKYNFHCFAFKRQKPESITMMTCIMNGFIPNTPLNNDMDCSKTVWPVQTCMHVRGCVSTKQKRNFWGWGGWGVFTVHTLYMWSVFKNNAWHCENTCNCYHSQHLTDGNCNALIHKTSYLNIDSSFFTPMYCRLSKITVHCRKWVLSCYINSDWFKTYFVNKCFHWLLKLG